MLEEQRKKTIEWLCIRENPISADIAIVFGSAREIDLQQRIQQGIKLYKDGFVPKLLLTGRGDMDEAILMEKIAIQCGVPKSNLLIEACSDNTVENVKFSLELLQKTEFLDRIFTIILVSSAWHMRRVLLITKKYFPPHIVFACYPPTENEIPSDEEEKILLTEAILAKAFLKHASLTA
ncbi:MAG: YdcF family protein [Candidatus Brocadiae bacterium]|nr:YdcF family protein [Candidatus Brocadiia bacterium]